MNGSGDRGHLLQLHSDEEALAVYTVIRTYLFDHPWPDIQEGDNAETEFQSHLRTIHRRIAEVIGWDGLEPCPPWEMEP